jgi:hypothetical protein
LKWFLFEWIIYNVTSAILFWGHAQPFSGFRCAVFFALISLQ